MPDEKANARMIELTEKLLVFQMYALGIRQTAIAKVIGKSPNWVNAMLKGLPRKQTE
ncbi:MAG: hypothetical protein WCF22_24585 [Candidatus Sulfotelmatobacter sp.]